MSAKEEIRAKIKDAEIMMAKASEGGFTRTLSQCIDRKYAFLEALQIVEMEELKIAEAVHAMADALEVAKQLPCDRCSGDCASANPPVSFCPIRAIYAALNLARAAGLIEKKQP